MGFFDIFKKKKKRREAGNLPPKAESPSLKDKLCESCGKPATNAISYNEDSPVRYFCKECILNRKAAKVLTNGQSQNKTIEQLYEQALREPHPYLLKDIEYPADYPAFKFCPNPLQTQSVVESSAPCECCGKSGKYSYVAGMDLADLNKEIRNLCLDCISNGEATKKFDGVFTDYSAIANRTADKAATDEIVHRTPSFTTWQDKEWLSHCKMPCAYIGRVYIGDLFKLGIYKQVRTDLAKTFYYRQMPMTIAEIDDMLIQMTEGSSLDGHLFRCVVCGKYRLHTDVD